MRFHKNLWLVSLMVLLLMAISLLVWFIFDVKTLYRTGSLRPSVGLSRNYTYRQTLTPAQIQDWMTFSYINYIFKLPANYLSDSLSIQDKHYPNLEIKKYAEAEKLDRATFLTKVEDAVTLYLNTPH